MLKITRWLLPSDILSYSKNLFVTISSINNLKISDCDGSDHVCRDPNCKNMTNIFVEIDIISFFTDAKLSVKSIINRCIDCHWRFKTRYYDIIHALMMAHLKITTNTNSDIANLILAQYFNPYLWTK